MNRRPGALDQPRTAMFKFCVILSFGLALGYSYGWKDAQTHDKHVAERMIERIGGDNKENFSGDIDSHMSKDADSQASKADRR